MRRLALSLVAIVLFSDVASAQLFPRAPWNRRASISNSGCPGGVCPSGTMTRASSVGHWTYPGTISSHLQNTHRVSTAGLTREQMLDLHDALHEGRAYTPTRIAKPAKSVLVPRVESPMALPVPAQARPKLQSDALFGLSAVEPEIPEHVLAQIAAPVDAGFRKELAKAIQTARKAGKIDVRQALKLRVAMLSPAFVEQAKELAVVQIAFSGESSEHVPVSPDGVVQVAGINWEGLAKFLEAFLPLLLSLLEAFGR